MSDLEIKTEIENILMTEIHADDSFNCRGVISPIDVVDLVKDIEKRGLIQPVVVTPYDEAKAKETGYKYLLIAGYRRHMAHQVLVKTRIEAIIRADIGNEVEARYFNLAENFQREDLTIMQEARALLKLQELRVTESDAAERLGASRGWVQIRYMLLKLPTGIQNEVEAGFITQTQIRELYALYLVGSLDQLTDAVKQMKDAKIAGRKTATIKIKTPKSQKKHRKRREINEMLDHMQEHLPNSFWARVMAWCSGEISTDDFEISIEEYAEEQYKSYVKI